jgi:serine phosphatase RsbU (regulator of sigma subunit)
LASVIWRQLVVGAGRRRTLLALAFAVVGPVVLTALLDWVRLPVALYLVVIIPAAYLGRLWPGLLAAGWSWVAMTYFLRGRARPSLRQPDDWVLLVLFVGVAVLIAVEEATRARASATQDRLALLAEANRTWMVSLDSGRAIAEFARLMVPGVADWCAIHVRTEGDGELRRHVTADDPERFSLLNEILNDLDRHTTYPLSPWGEALMNGRSFVFRRITDDVLRQFAGSDDLLERLRGAGLVSAMIVPLIGRPGVQGTLTLVTAQSRRRYTEADLRYAEELARTAGSAIENARLHESQSRMAQTLQSSLLTTDIPEIPGVDIVVRYRPASEGALVGGDFYDIFEAGEGWAVALGDVSGKGPEAAAVTGLVRYTVRAAIVREVKPSSVLEAVNRQILRQNVPRFCTAAVGRIELADGGLRLLLSCAGHPPPLVYRREQRVESLECKGSVLGVWPDPQLVDIPVDLRPGDAIVFYTDGIIERFERAGRGGDAQLVALLWEEDVGNAKRIADRIYEEAAVPEGERPMDDMALVVLGVRETGETPSARIDGSRTGS